MLEFCTLHVISDKNFFLGSYVHFKANMYMCSIASIKIIYDSSESDEMLD